MGAEKTSLWTRFGEFVGYYWTLFRSPVEVIQLSRPRLASLPEPLKDNVRRLSSGHKEIVARIQQLVGVAPTEGRELVQDIHLTKCRSAGIGAARLSTNVAHSQTDRAQVLLSTSLDDALDENWSAEEMRDLTRAALTDILRRR